MQYQDSIPELSELFNAYFDCRRNKRFSDNALSYEINFEENIIHLYHKLIKGTYSVKPSIFFVLNEGKPREIWAADFEDRIVHHLFYNRFLKRFSNSFIHDSYSCLPNKGTHKAAIRLSKMVRSASNNYQKKLYYLQCDIKSFYMSIDKEVLYNIVSKKVYGEFWNNLLKIIIFNDPKQNAIRNSSYKRCKNVPYDKSLWNKPENIGIPIGNLSSQFFANILLNELDQYCKNVLKIKFYIRYADDIVILSESPKFLNFVFSKMKDFVKNSLKLEFHDKKTVLQHTSKGINFVGFILLHYRTYIRRKTLNKFRRMLPKLSSESFKSYIGILSHSNSFRVRSQLTKEYNNEICLRNTC
jgi:RNA-directed DNA polymerase